MQAIQKKYKGKTDPASREAMSRETMALYREHGTNPFASCLPILLQSPIFFALFRVLIELPAGRVRCLPADRADDARARGIGRERHDLRRPAVRARSCRPATTGTSASSRAVLIIAMSATTFLTQRQLTMKNMPPAALQGPMAQQQKVLLYVLPLIFAFSGVNFPIGVLIYWTTTNLWSMGQQFYTIRRMPAPGSQAEIAMKERKARKAPRMRTARSRTHRRRRPCSSRRSRAVSAQQPKRKDRNKPRPPSTDDVTDKPVPVDRRRPRRARRAKAPGAPTKPKK